MKRLLIASLFAFSCAGDQASQPMAPGTGRVESSLTGLASGGPMVKVQTMGPGTPGKPLGVTQIIVTVAKVTAHSSSAGWVTLSTTETTVDILKLADYAAPLGFANLPAGKITQVRLYVKDGGTQYVIRDDGVQVDLKVPSGIESGIKIKGLFDVASCNLTGVPIQWDGHKSIWVHPTGQQDEWILRPVIRLGDITASNVGCTSGSGPNGSPNPGNPNGNPTGGNPPGNLPPGANPVGGNTPGSMPGGNPTGQPPVTDPTGQPTPGAPGVTEGPGSGMPTTGPTSGVLPTGAACTGGSMCLSGVCSGGSCGLGGAGVPCSAATDCRSGTCGADNVCGVGTAVGAGMPCTGNSDCLSNACTAGVCEAGGQGEPCNAATDCAQGFSCSAGSCEPMIN
jgi:hypothetical protein